MPARQPLPLIAVALALSVGPVAIPIPGAAANVSGPGVVVRDQTTTVSTARAASAYWTTARMRAAVRNSGELSGVPFASARRLAGARPGPAHLPGMKAIGRVFTTKADGTPWSCTGTLVDSPNGSVVWTAAHCIHTGRGGAFHSNLAFAPGYQSTTTGNPTPYGLWPAFTSAVTGSWTVKGVTTRTGDQRIWRTAQYDAAGLVLVRGADGRPAADTVGAAQHIRFRVRKSRVRMLGYPVAGPYLGNVLMQCGPGRLRTRRFAVNLMGIRCPVGPGMSGGPALMGLDAFGVGTVIGEMTAWDRVHMYVSFQGRELRRLYRHLSGVAN